MNVVFTLNPQVFTNVAIHNVFVDENGVMQILTPCIVDMLKCDELFHMILCVHRLPSSNTSASNSSGIAPLGSHYLSHTAP